MATNRFQAGALERSSSDRSSSGRSRMGDPAMVRVPDRSAENYGGRAGYGNSMRTGRAPNKNFQRSGFGGRSFGGYASGGFRGNGLPSLPASTPAVRILAPDMRLRVSVGAKVSAMVTPVGVVILAVTATRAVVNITTEGSD